MASASIHAIQRSDPDPEPPGAKLFSLIWEALADLLGTATTAVILRRAARRAIASSPELAELEISLRELEYRYTLPRIWTDGPEATPRGLRALVGELVPLLHELTGRIAVRRLEQIPELRGRGLLPPGPEERSS